MPPPPNKKKTSKQKKQTQHGFVFLVCFFGLIFNYLLVSNKWSILRHKIVATENADSALFNQQESIYIYMYLCIYI